MNSIKITSMPRAGISEFYNLRKYRRHASEQIIVTEYEINSLKIIIDE